MHPTKQRISTPLGIPLDFDVSGASNHVDRVRLLAHECENFEIDVYEVAQWLRSSGHSEATEYSMRSTIYGKLKAADDFRKVRERVFRYVPSELAHDCPDQEADTSGVEEISSFPLHPDWTAHQS